MTTTRLPPIAPPSQPQAEPAPRPSRRRGTRRAASITAGAVAIALSLPLVSLVFQSLSRSYVFPQVLPAHWSLRAWRLVLAAGADTWLALGWSVAVASVVAVLALLIAVPVGRTLGLVSFRGRRFVEFLLLVPLLVPPMTVAIGLDITFIRLGLSGSFPGVVLVHLIPAAPYAVLVMAGVFANYDADYEAAAKTLGAGRISVFRFVTLPAIRPGLVVAGFFAFIVSWSQYVLTLQIGAGKIVTLPVLVVAAASGSDVSVTGALTVVYTLPVVVLLVLVSRHLGRARFGAGRS